MAYNVQPFNFKLTGRDMGAFDLGDALKKGFENYKGYTEAKNAPRKAEAEITELRGRAQKNLMMSKLLESLTNGGGLQDFGSGGNSNLRAAALKAATGIDPYLRSPEQEADLRTKTAVEQASKKLNVETGSSDVAREYLQDKVSMPPEYSGTGASYHMIMDRYLAGNGDKAAQERLIQAAVAEKLVPEYSGFQLMSQGQRATIPALDHQQDAIRQGWPKAARLITRNLPPELQKEAERRHNEIVKGVNRSREAFLNGEGKRSDVVPRNNNPSNKIKWTDIQHTAQQRGMTENDVIDKLAKKAGITVDEFMKRIEAGN